MQHIRPNIDLLEPFANEIEQCTNFNQLAKIFFNANDISNDIKGAFGENFADQICLYHSNITGWSTDFRPATPDEDYYNGVDAIGKVQKLANNIQPIAVRQDKAYNPFNKHERLSWDSVSRAGKLILQGKIPAGNLMIFTTLPASQVDSEVKDTFNWIVSKDNYENAIDNNGDFYKTFADYIRVCCNKIQSSHKQTIKEFNKNKKTPLDFQYDAINHSIREGVSSIIYPPGSGKTLIQSKIILEWSIDSNCIVYYAPTLDLLDQNFYKVALELSSANIPVQLVAICSRKKFSLTHDENYAFIDPAQLITGNLNNQDVQNALLDKSTLSLVAVTYASMPSFVGFASNNHLIHDRIADEALEVIPGKEIHEDAEDFEEKMKRWNSFKDIRYVNRSTSFDAFEKESNSKDGPGTNNRAVFGPILRKSIPEMIDRGTIVPLRLRILVVDIDQNKRLHSADWDDDDKINFNALCKAADDLYDDPLFSNKKIIAFMQNAQINLAYMDPLKDYLKGKIDFVEPIIAETADRMKKISEYKNTNNGILLNYGVLGKGIDDHSTPATFIGRNMVHIFGMHGIHRGCRSWNSEYGLPPEQHVKKPYGIAYVIVNKNNDTSELEYDDLKELLRKLYTTGWKDKVKIVNPLKPNTDDNEDDLVDKPDSGNNADDLFEVNAQIMNQITIVKEEITSKNLDISVNQLYNELFGLEDEPFDKLFE